VSSIANNLQAALEPSTREALSATTMNRRRVGLATIDFFDIVLSETGSVGQNGYACDPLSMGG
jgi:hypothetical protein